LKPHIQFLTSAASPQQFPADDAPEIAFLGRSNVGKSSLLNSLVGTKVAHVGSTPGRTRTINFFALRWKEKQANPDILLVDLPGYGYARVSRELSAGWPGFIDPYLKERRSLVLCVALIDINVPPQASDRSLLDFLRSAGREFVVVATKSDKLSGNKLRTALSALANAHQIEEVLAYSAKTGAGREELWKRIREAERKNNISSEARNP
jgi:GTP-binding protein